MQHILSIVMILIGAVVMLISLVKARELHVLTPFIPERSQPTIIRSLRLHRGLMLFFRWVTAWWPESLPFVSPLSAKSSLASSFSLAPSSSSLAFTSRPECFSR